MAAAPSDASYVGISSTSDGSTAPTSSPCSCSPSFSTSTGPWSSSSPGAAPTYTPVHSHSQHTPPSTARSTWDRRGHQTPPNGAGRFPPGHTTGHGYGSRQQQLPPLATAGVGCGGREFARYRSSHGDRRMPMDPVKDPVLDPDYPVTHSKLCPVYITIVTCRYLNDP